MFGLIGLMGFAAFMYLMFFRAYFNYNKEVLLLINTNNEANFEAVMFIFFLPFIFYFILDSIKKLKNE